MMAFVYPHSDDPRFLAQRVNGRDGVTLQIAEEGGLEDDDEAAWEDQPSVSFDDLETARRWVAALVAAARAAGLYQPAEQRHREEKP